MKPSARSNGGQIPGTATLPKAPVVPPPPDATTPLPIPPSSGRSTVTPIPVLPPEGAQPKPKFMTLQITATHVVWLQVVADGNSQMLTMKPGEVKTWQAEKLIHIRAGKAGAVKLVWNGVAQPSIGSLGSPGNKDFARENAPTPPAPSATPTPARPTPPPNPHSAPSGPAGGPR